MSKVKRNWKVTGLTDDNEVILKVELAGRGEQTVQVGGPPSYYMCDYLTRAERGILRRGLTPSGRDRKHPK